MKTKRPGKIGKFSTPKREAKKESSNRPSRATKPKGKKMIIAAETVMRKIGQIEKGSASPKSHVLNYAKARKKAPPDMLTEIAHLSDYDQRRALVDHAHQGESGAASSVASTVAQALRTAQFAGSHRNGREAPLAKAIRNAYKSAKAGQQEKAILAHLKAAQPKPTVQEMASALVSSGIPAHRAGRVAKDWDSMESLSKPPAAKPKSLPARILEDADPETGATARLRSQLAELQDRDVRRKAEAPATERPLEAPVLTGLDKLLEDRIQAIIDTARKAQPGLQRWLAVDRFITESDSRNTAQAVLNHAVDAIMKVPKSAGFSADGWLKQVSHDFEAGKGGKRNMLYHMRDVVAKWDLARGAEMVDATDAIEALLRFCGYPDLDEVGLCFSHTLEKRIAGELESNANSSNDKSSLPVFKVVLNFPKSFSAVGWLEEYVSKSGISEDRDDVEDSYSGHMNDVAELKGISESAMALAFSQDYGINLIQEAIDSASEEFRSCRDDRIIAIALEAIRMHTPVPTLREIATLNFPTFVELIRLLDACVSSGYWKGEQVPSKADVMRHFEIWHKEKRTP